MSLIVYSIPVFFLLIGIELLIAKMKGLSYYRFNDAITNLSCGIGSQVVGVLLKTATFIGYLFLYNHSPLKGITPNNWWSIILLFLGVDFFYYWFHRLAHEISILWGSHVVHHQSEEYNLTVALRQAWLQGAFSWIFYLPLAYLGFEPGIFIAITSINTLYQFWIHTKLIGKMWWPIELIFNTPSHHRVHHGVNPKYIDRNHAGSLIIWDRLFGTFQEEEEEVVYGITKQPKSWNPLWVNFEYWIDLFKDAFSVRSIKNFFLVLFKMPGWKPQELGGIEPVKEVSVGSFKKYDTEISSGLNYYVFFQFVLVLVGATLFLLAQGKEPLNSNLPLKFLSTAFIIFSIVNIGAIFEKRTWVKTLEYARIIAVCGFVIFVLRESPSLYMVLGVSAVFMFISFVWFSRFGKEFSVNTVSV